VMSFIILSLPMSYYDLARSDPQRDSTMPCLGAFRWDFPLPVGRIYAADGYNIFKTGCSR
jgi:hypothetical protein